MSGPVHAVRARGVASIGGAREVSALAVTGPAAAVAPNPAMAAMKGWGDSGSETCGGAEALTGSMIFVPRRLVRSRG